MSEYRVLFFVERIVNDCRDRYEFGERENMHNTTAIDVRFDGCQHGHLCIRESLYLSDNEFAWTLLNKSLVEEAASVIH